MRTPVTLSHLRWIPLQPQALYLRRPQRPYIARQREDHRRHGSIGALSESRYVGLRRLL
jgi:hypothetical protein